MNISLSDIGKRFGTQWIFRNVNCEFPGGSKTVIVGHNGSGKSTLLQIISGYTTPSKGNVAFGSAEDKMDEDEVFKHIGICSPGMELFDNLTLEEHLKFHFTFKDKSELWSDNEIIDLLFLEDAKTKLIKNFSSGMKQRLKLGLTLLSDVKVLLLDEPISNLDAQGVQWYQDIINKYCVDKTIIVCSNEKKVEYEFCTEQIDMMNYK